MLRECGLIAELSVLSKSLQARARQIYTVEIDLLFKQVCKQVSHTKTAYSQVSSVLQDYSMIESNRTRRVQGLIHGTFDKGGNDISSISGSGMKAGNGLNRSRTSRSAVSLFSPGHRSRMNSTLNDSMMRGGGDRSGSRTSERGGGSVSATRAKVDPQLDKFDFPCFVTFLIKLGPKVYPDINESQVAVKCLIDDFIMPLYRSVAEAK